MNAAEPSTTERRSGDDPIGEVAGAWAVAIAASGLATWLLPPRLAQSAVPVCWAAVALGTVGWRHRTDWRRFGLGIGRPLAAFGWTALYAAVVFPPFVLAWFVLFGADGWRWPGVAVFGAALGHHVLWAGLPEELFFRGYVQSRLADRWPAREGAQPCWFAVLFEPAVLAAAALFAVTHLAYEANPLQPAALGRLLTFFPGVLFGALRRLTGGLLAPVLFHALCNALLETLQVGYGAN